METSSRARLKQRPTADGIQLSVHVYTPARKTKPGSFCQCLALQEPSPSRVQNTWGPKQSQSLNVLKDLDESKF